LVFGKNALQTTVGIAKEWNERNDISTLLV